MVVDIFMLLINKVNLMVVKHGFISKILPSKVVFDASGIKCAYKKVIKGYNRK